MNVWVCLVRRQAFVGGESQRCHHAETCEKCGGTGRLVPVGTNLPCPECNGSGQVSECGEMELIGGEPLEWCSRHDSPRHGSSGRCQWAFFAVRTLAKPCLFESNVRVKVTE